jgi:hypothetical protein
MERGLPERNSSRSRVGSIFVKGKGFKNLKSDVGASSGHK